MDDDGSTPSIAVREENERYYISVLLRVFAAWFYLAAFPSFILVFSHGSCVSFQGISPAVDFIGIQLLFLAVFPALAAPRLLESPPFVRYLRFPVIANLLVQLAALCVHTIGLTFDSSILVSDCFQVDTGGVWYTLVANLGGSILFAYLFFRINKLVALQRRLPTQT